FSNIL
ncbi:Aspartate--ammonia ligase, partial [Haemophilus influenzae]